MAGSGTDWRIADPQIFERLRREEEFTQIVTAYFTLEGRCYGWDVTCSERRLLLAYSYFIEELGRAGLIMPDGTLTMDQYKYAAALVFWLRRLLPIEDMQPYDGPMPLGGARDGQDLPLDDRREFFAKYGDEVAAFRIGHLLCQYAHISHLMRQRDSGTTVTLQRGAPTERAFAHVSADFLHDLVVNLKHKINSQHSIYLVFRSIFENARPPRAETAP
jgi:hypothetical protein